MSNVNELVALVHTKQQGPKILAPTAGLGKAANNRFLAQVSFYLQPIRASLSLLIGASSVLGNNSFQAFLGNQIEKSDALLRDMIT